MESDYKTEFERAMRGCRRRVQERIDREHGYEPLNPLPADDKTPPNSIGASGE